MPRQKKAINDYEQFNKIKNYLIMNTPTISVPQKMVYINNNGDKKVINTLTKNGKLSTRDKKQAVKFVNDKDDDNNVYVKNNGYSLSMRSKRFVNEINSDMTQRLITHTFKNQDEIYKLYSLRKRAKKPETIKKYDKLIEKYENEENKIKRFLPQYENKKYIEFYEKPEIEKYKKNMTDEYDLFL